MELKDMNGSKLDETFEKKLEFLWDMTIEKDVVKTLLEYDVLEIFASIIDKTEDERLVEILLGIIGNMCVGQAETREKLCSNAEVMSIILNQLSSPDPLVLHQLMRLLHSAILFENLSSDDEKACFSHFEKCENLIEKFSFILSNSTSNTLLLSSFEALNAICAKFAVIECHSDSEKDSSFPQMFVKKCLIEGIIEAFKTAIPVVDNDSTATDLIPTQNQQKFMNLFLELNVILSQYESLSIEAYKDVLVDFQKCLGRVLLPLTQKMYLLPLRSDHQGVIENINDIIQALGDPFYCENFSRLVVVWDLIEEEKNRDKSNSDWEDEDESGENIDSDDLSMTILEFLTRTGFNSTQEELSEAMKCLNEDLAMKLYERISDNEDPEDEIKTVIEKMKVSFKQIWDINV
jgi:hypothetical protein